MTASNLDDRLMRAMREGHEVLPDDLALLRGYLRLIEGLLAEKATELEPDWAQACASAVEIETLQALESVVVERAIGVRASDVSAMRVKLDIWRLLVAGDEDGHAGSSSHRLVLSVADDLERLEAQRRV